jgi:hypothetical protein
LRLAALAGLLLLSCSVHWKGNEVTSSPAPADLVIRNAQLIDPVRGRVGTAIAARGGRIVALGYEPEVGKLIGLSTRVLDAGGGALVPGLVDAHAHLLGLGFELDRADLRGARSEDEMVSRAAEFAKRKFASGGGGEGWVLGRGWDQNLWPGAKFPTQQKLNDKIPERPVFLTRVDGHAAVANGAAMRIAGVHKSTRDPDGGKIERDADGNPTGLFIDTAMDLVGRAIPAPDSAAIERAFLAAQDSCVSLGLTGVDDAGVDESGRAALQKLDAQGKLRLRVYAMASAGSIPAGPIYGDRFTLRAVKAYADGALGSRGAALLEPYSDDPHNSGLLVTSREGLDEIAELCVARGMQLCTHAIGDRANRIVLDVYEKALTQRNNSEKAASAPAKSSAAFRWRIEHCQIVAPPDFDRFASLGIVASMQPTHATSDGPWAPARVGEARMAGAYAWREMLQRKIPLAFGSDFPVESADPKLGLFAAVARRPPESPPNSKNTAPVFGPSPAITAREALHAFTAGAAFAEFAEHERGRLEPSYLADFTVFDSNPFEAPDPAAFLRARVVWTVIGGSVAFPK